MPSAGSPRSVLQRPSSEVERGLRVVVLGAGVAGVLSAHVACQHAHSVWLVEGDSLAAGGGEASAAEEIMKVRLKPLPGRDSTGATAGPTRRLFSWR